MNVAMGVSTIISLILTILVSQSITAPLRENDTELLRLHRHAMKWLRDFQYLTDELQAAPSACENCKVENDIAGSESGKIPCPGDCLNTLRDLIMPGLKKFQWFYRIEATGILSEVDLIKMAEPRCGDSDEKDDDDKNSKRTKRYARLGSTTWPAEEMPLKISVYNSVRGFSVDDVENIALECARLWAEPSSLSFQLAAKGAKGNIHIQFEYIDGKWNTVGLGLSPVIWGEKSSYLKLDRDEDWKKDAKTNARGVSLKWAICHEMGHNMGLSHSNDRTAIMYPSGIGQDEDKLPRDDYNGITSLYRGRNGQTVFGRAASNRSGPVPRRPPPPPPRPQTRAPTRPTRAPTRPTRAPTRPTRAPTRRPFVPNTRGPVTRPPATRAPPPTTKYRPPTAYRTYRPPSGKRFAPPGHKPYYRPSATRPPTSRTTQPVSYWYYDASQDRWVHSG